MRSRSVALELALAVGLVVTVTFGAFAYLSVRWQREWLLEEAQRGLSLTGETLQSSLRENMLLNRRQETASAIERVAADTRVEAIRIINHEGRIGLSTRHEEIGQTVSMSTPACTLCHSVGEKPGAMVSLDASTRTRREIDALRASTPVLAEAGCSHPGCHPPGVQVLGVIDVVLPLEELDRSLARGRARMVATALAGIVLAGGLAWAALTGRLGRPMKDLTAGMQRVADGDLSYRIPVRTRDELGRLAESFNRMTADVAVTQEGLIQSERLISMGKLAAGVAHEVNNPLTGILSYAEGLLEESEPSDPRREDYQVIVRETLRCRQIVRGLLDFARQETPRLVPVDPHDLIEKAWAVVVRQEAFRKIRLVQEIEEDLPEIGVDPVQIQQVLVNLILNAQQAMPEGGEIVLGAKRSGEGSRVELFVKDQGTGIPPDVRSRIFEPFFSTKDGKTDGLGLAVSLGIVRRHGGILDYETELGKGTRFRVVLPVVGRSSGPMGETGDE